MAKALPVPTAKAAPEPKPLTAKQRLFVAEYLKDHNAKQAYIRAGYQSSDPASHASRLLDNPRIAALVAQQTEDLVKEAGVDVVRLLREANEIALSSLADAFDDQGRLLNPREMSPKVLATLASVKVVEMAGGLEVKDGGETRHVPMYTKELKLWDKPGAIFKLLDYVQGVRPAAGTVINGNVNIAVNVQADELMAALTDPIN